LKLYYQIFLPIAKRIARKGAKVVKQDCDDYQDYVNSQWTLEHKLADLENDKELSPSYLRSLILDCSDENSLMKVLKYLSFKSKTGNLSSSQRTSIIKKAKEKILDINIELYEEKRRKELREKLSNGLEKLS